MMNLSRSKTVLYVNQKFMTNMDKIQFKVKFFGTKERKGQIKQQAIVVMAASEAKVEDALRLQGWVTIHGLKIRKAQ